jgi:hypothetical protein
MPTVIYAKTRRSFPGHAARYRAIGLAGPRRRGMGDYYSDLSNELTYLPSAASSLFQNLHTGTTSAAQLRYIQDQAYIDNVRAATDPNTGQVNQALLDQANAQTLAETTAAANVSPQSTGSVLADLVDTAQGQGPGVLASLGITPNPSSLLPSINWSSLLQSILIFGALGVGGYLIVKKL